MFLLVSQDNALNNVQHWHRISNLATSIDVLFEIRQYHSSIFRVPTLALVFFNVAHLIFYIQSHLRWYCLRNIASFVSLSVFISKIYTCFLITLFFLFTHRYENLNTNSKNRLVFCNTRLRVPQYNCIAC